MATDMHPPAALLKAALMHNKMSLEDGYDAIDQVFPPPPTTTPRLDKPILAPLWPQAGETDDRMLALIETCACKRRFLSDRGQCLMWRDTDASLKIGKGDVKQRGCQPRRLSRNSTTASL
jgi:hypothetical protein